MPKNRHSILQMLLTEQLRAQARQLQLAVRPELRIRTNPTRFRIPDVCVYEGVQAEEVPSRPPLLTFEVTSDSEPMSALKAKVRDHLSMGTRLAIVIDPEDRSVLLQDGHGLRSLESRLLQVETKKGVLEIDFDALFAEMDQELSPE